MDSVSEAMIWLVNDGTICRQDNAPVSRAAQTRRQHEIFGAQRQKAPAHLPPQPGPADDREDDRDAEITPLLRPVTGQRRAQRHPQRQGGDRADKLDHALDDVINPTAIVAGDAAQHDAQAKAQEDGHQANGQRDPRHRTARVTAYRAPAGLSPAKQPAVPLASSPRPNK